MSEHGTRVDLEAVACLYSKSLEKYGATSIGVGWPNSDQHKLRFDKLAMLIDEDHSEISVNDLGCGYGALYHYLVEAGYRISSYRGYDISSEMLVEARKRLPADRVVLSASSALEARADYSFASGIFNVRFEESDDAWLEHIKRTLANMHEHSTKGFAFNLLSTYVDYRREHLYYGDSLFFFDYCKREFSPFVALLHDYPLYEWTMIVRKP